MMNKKMILSAVLALGFLAAVSAAEKKKVMRYEGMVLDPTSAEQTCSVMVPVPYDPDNDMSAQIVKVKFTPATKLFMLHQAVKAEAVPQGATVKLSLFLEEHKKLEAGKPFTVRSAIYEPGLKVCERRWLIRLPLFLNDDKSGTVSYKGQKIPVKIPTGVSVHSPAKFEQLVSACSFVSVTGTAKDNETVARQVIIVRHEDPRKTDDPALPRVLVIGDSISMNYHNAAKAALKGKFNYHRIYGNSGDTRNGIRHLDIWLGPMKEKWQKWDVVVLNHGLHDLKQPGIPGKKEFPEKHQVEPEEYRKNMECILNRLTRHPFKVVVCTTTPVPNNSFGRFGRRKDEDLKYNQVLREVVRKYPQVVLCDLNAVVRNSTVFDQWRTGSNVHFRAEEQNVLGKSVAEAILRAFQGSGK